MSKGPMQRPCRAQRGAFSLCCPVEKLRSALPLSFLRDSSAETVRGTCGQVRRDRSLLRLRSRYSGGIVAPQLAQMLPLRLRVRGPASHRITRRIAEARLSAELRVRYARPRRTQSAHRAPLRGSETIRGGRVVNLTRGRPGRAGGRSRRSRSRPPGRQGGGRRRGAGAPRARVRCGGHARPRAGGCT